MKEEFMYLVSHFSPPGMVWRRNDPRPILSAIPHAFAFSKATPLACTFTYAKPAASSVLWYADTTPFCSLLMLRRSAGTFIVVT